MVKSPWCIIDMATRLKHKLVGADGGKHPHLKDAQDYSVEETARQWPAARIARANLETVLSLLQSKPVRETLGHHTAMERAMNEVVALMRLLGE